MTFDQAKREADLDGKIIKMFQAQLDKELKADAAARSKAAKRHENALKDYRSEADILDAYGYGFITRKQCDQLMRAWKNMHEPKTVRQDFIAYLKREIEFTQTTLREMEKVIRGGGNA